VQLPTNFFNQLMQGHRPPDRIAEQLGPSQTALHAVLKFFRQHDLHRHQSSLKHPIATGGIAGVE
jgi:hypothetical protein